MAVSAVTYLLTGLLTITSMNDEQDLFEDRNVQSKDKVQLVMSLATFVLSALPILAPSIRLLHSLCQKYGQIHLSIQTNVFRSICVKYSPPTLAPSIRLLHTLCQMLLSHLRTLQILPNCFLLSFAQLFGPFNC